MRTGEGDSIVFVIWISNVRLLYLYCVSTASPLISNCLYRVSCLCELYKLNQLYELNELYPQPPVRCYLSSRHRLYKLNQLYELNELYP